mmetsp:Transcript_6623/g.11529  ORF Transcript_6623/g.11529 Transcript_6623/m.11529 type:complete len:215 (+) Transcript_6623:954-1598(+)
MHPLVLIIGSANDLHPHEIPLHLSTLAELNGNIGVLHEPAEASVDLPFGKETQLGCESSHWRVHCWHVLNTCEVDNNGASCMNLNRSPYSLRGTERPYGAIPVHFSIADHQPMKEVSGEIRCLICCHLIFTGCAPRRVGLSHGQVEDVPVWRLPDVEELCLCVELLVGGEDRENMRSFGHGQLVRAPRANTTCVQLSRVAAVRSPFGLKVPQGR